MSGFPGEDQTYLYATQIGSAIKIGFSKDPRGRAGELEGVLLRVIFGDHRDEKEVHEQLAPYALGSELFIDCDDVRAVISKWHTPSWLDRVGGWMPFGRIVLPAAIEQELLAHEPLFSDGRFPRNYVAKRRWSSWMERDHKIDSEPLGLDGMAA